MTDTNLGYAPHPFYVKYVVFANLTVVQASCWSGRTFLTSRKAQLHAILFTLKPGSLQNALLSSPRNRPLVFVVLRS